MKSPLPQSLPKECSKAAKIFKSFVDSGNNGLDGVIPRRVLEDAKGFAIFTMFKAGFVFSARGGSGVVIAKLEDGSWSAPSAIGTAGVGFGGQAGAEMTDFLVVLNSRAAVKSFMAAGSLTLGGNLSVAVGPLGRNGEAIGSVNSSGKLAAMYSYSKTRGLFGGVSIEGSVIMERADANQQAYHNTIPVAAILNGAITPPEWAMPLVRTLEACTGMPGNRQWVQELQKNDHSGSGYMFDGVASPGSEHPTNRYPYDMPEDNNTRLKKLKSRSNSVGFPPASWGKPKNSGSFFADQFHDPSRAPVPIDSPLRSAPSRPSRAWDEDASTRSRPTTSYFDTNFESDFIPDEEMRKHPVLSTNGRTRESDEFRQDSPYTASRSKGSDVTSHRRAYSAYGAAPAPSYDSDDAGDPFAHSDDLDDVDYGGRRTSVYGSSKPPPKFDLKPKPDLTKPLSPSEGVARAIALYNFAAVQPGDLSFNKGQVIVVTEKSTDTNTWWKGKLEGREGNFPANFVEVV